MAVGLDISDAAWNERLTDKEKINYLSQFKKHKVNKKLNFIFIFTHPQKELLASFLENLYAFFIINIDKPIYNKVTIELHDLNSWIKKTKAHPPSEDKLPSARFTIMDHQPLIEFIMPNNFVLNEVLLINVIRLFGSEVLGKIIFDQYVPNRYPFNKLPILTSANYDYNIQEKSLLCRIYSKEFPAWRQYFTQLGITFSNDQEKRLELGAKNFFSDLLYSKGNFEFVREVNNWFIGFDKLFLKKYKPSVEVSKVLQSVKSLGLFTPTEQIALSRQVNLANVLQQVSYRLKLFLSYWSSFCAAAKSVQELENPLKQIKLIYSASEDSTLGEAKFDSGLESNKKILKLLMKNLLAENHARDFLIDESLLNKNQIYELKKFKLSLHLKYYSKNSKLNAVKQNEQLLNSFKFSAWQVVYNLCFYASEILTKKNTYQSLKNQINQCLTWYMINKETIEDFNFLSEYLIKKLEQVSQVKLESFNEFRRGWANFFGNGFLMFFYNANPNRDIFKNLNFNGLVKNIYLTSFNNLNRPSFLITAVLLHCFRNNGNKLKSMLSFVQIGNSQIDAIALNSFTHWDRGKILKTSKDLATNL